MEKSEMIKNVRAMMSIADKRMKGVVKEEVNYRLEYSAYHYIKFAFYPSKGACIEYGSHSNTYTRMFADFTSNYGGCIGGEDVYTYDGCPQHVLRADMMRAALLGWKSIKVEISKAVDKEYMIDNFVL